MKKYIITVFLILFVLLGTTANAEYIEAASPEEFTELLVQYISDTQDISAASESEFDTNRIIVVCEKDFDSYGALYTINDGNNLYVLIYDSNDEAKEAYDKLLKNPDILAITPDGVVYVEPTLSTAEIEVTDGHLSWGSAFTGLDGFNKYVKNYYDKLGEELPEIKVAVIDTGIDTTSSLFDDRVYLDKGRNYINTSDEPIDYHRHGTHVSGIICDNTLPNVKLIPYKVMSAEGKGALSLTISAIRQAQSDGADVINLSLAGRDSSYSYRRKYSSVFEASGIDGAATLDCTFVAAAGNQHDNVKYYFPANVSNVITVSSCNKNGEFDGVYSNYGSQIDICAPGTDINSTVLGGEYLQLSGTSMACPFVTAAIAMLKTLYPDAKPAALQDMLFSNATDVGEPGPDDYYGHGLLDLHNLYDDEDDSDFGTASYENGIISLDINAENGELANGAFLYAAAYKNGICTGSAQDTISHVVTSSYKTQLSLPDNGEPLIRIFLWDSNMKPIGKSITIR